MTTMPDNNWHDCAILHDFCVSTPSTWEFLTQTTIIKKNMNYLYK